MIPAFPRPVSVTPASLESNQQVAFDQQGMTLLDYFACHFADSVMKQFPLMTPPVDLTEKEKDKSKQCRRTFIALESYALAKMFLEVRDMEKT